MYHISEDPRRIESAERILRGLEMCLDRKSLAGISVTDVCGAAGIGRSTFYRLFDNLTDVFRYYSDNAHDMVYQHLTEGDESTLRETCLRSIKMLTCRPLLLDTLLSENMLDIICQSHMKHRDAIRMKLGDVGNLDDGRLDYLIYHMSAMTAVYLRVWHIHGKTESAASLYDVMKLDSELLGKVM